MAQHQLAAVDGERIGAVGVVDLLRQRLEHLEAEQEGEQRRAHQSRCGAAQHRDLADAGPRRDGGHSHQAARRCAQQAVPAAAPHRVAAPTSREAQPRAGAGVLVGQLATQQHHGAQVLHRDGEAQLGHQIGASGERFERDAAEPAQPDSDDREHHRHGDQVDGALTPAPHRHAADCIAGARYGGGHGGDLPADDGEPQCGRRGKGQPPGVCHEGCADPQQADDGSEHRTAREPGHRRARQAAPGELGEGTSGHGAGKGGAA
jgi:hypothetical protein